MAAAIASTLQEQSAVTHAFSVLMQTVSREASSLAGSTEAIAHAAEQVDRSTAKVLKASAVA